MLRMWTNGVNTFLCWLPLYCILVSVIAVHCSLIVVSQLRHCTGNEGGKADHAETGAHEGQSILSVGKLELFNPNRR